MMFLMRDIVLTTRRLLLKSFKEMLVGYIAENGNDITELRTRLRNFWNNNIDSIEFHASFLTRRPHEEGLKDIVDNVEVMFSFMFHFTSRDIN